MLAHLLTYSTYTLSHKQTGQSKQQVKVKSTVSFEEARKWRKKEDEKEEQKNDINKIAS